ncbi:hypothetical protein CsSME_00003188 [Camellia sinensis var. sinensis]
MAQGCYPYLVSKRVTRPKLLPSKFWSQPAVRPLVIQGLLADYDTKPIEVGLGRDTIQGIVSID